MEPVRVQSQMTPTDPTTEPTPTPTPEPMKGENESFLGEILKFAIIALVIVVPFRMFIAQPFIVSGASMAPTFETGQYLIIDQVSYRLHEPDRGDVIIFRFPEDLSKFFIKRVIGLPGETVELNGSDVVIKDSVTGEQFRLEENYVAANNQKNDFQTVTLGKNEYFVMGDNRAASSDSRVWGPVPEQNIVGQAFLRLLPFSAAEFQPGGITSQESS